jgi:hypothetical protein
MPTTSHSKPRYTKISALVRVGQRKVSVVGGLTQDTVVAESADPVVGCRWIDCRHFLADQIGPIKMRRPANLTVDVAENEPSCGDCVK